MVELIVNHEKLSLASYTHCRAVASVAYVVNSNYSNCSGGARQLRLVPSLLSRLPSWLFDDESEYQRRLESLLPVNLVECCRNALMDNRKRRTKKEAIQLIIDRFIVERSRVLELRTPESWDVFCATNAHSLGQFQCSARLISVATRFRSIFRDVVFGSL